MADSVIGLLFEISADPSNASAAIARFEAETGQRLNQTAQHAKEATGIMSEGLDFLKEHLVFTIGEFVNLAREAGEALTKAAEFGEQIMHASERTGIATEQISGLAFAAKQTGTGVDTLQMGLTRLSRAVSGLGSPQAADALEDLGVKTTDVHGKLLPLHEILLRVADAFHAHKDGSQKAADAQAIFGRGGAALIPLLNRGRAGLLAMEGAAKELGLTLTEKDAKALEEMNEQLTLNDARMQGVWLRISKFLAPELVSLSNLITLNSQTWHVWGDNVAIAIDRVLEGVFYLSKSTRKALADAADQLATNDLVMQQHQEELLKAFAGGAQGTKDFADALGDAGLTGSIKKVKPALEKAADASHKFWDALERKKEPGGEGVFPKLAAQADIFAEALKRLAEEAKSKELQQAIAMTTGVGGLGLPAFGASGVDPFGKMAQSLNQAIVPFTNFDKLFKELIKDIPAVTLQGDKFATETSRWIQQVGLMSESMTLLKNTSTQVFNTMAQAMGQAAANALVYGKNFGAAMEQALKQTMASIAGQALVHAIFETAAGFGDLAIQDYPDAALHFQAAGIYALVGGAAAGIGASIPGGGAGGAGGGARPGSGVPGPGSGTVSPRGPGGAGGYGGAQVIVNIEGMISPDTFETIAPALTAAISSAVQNGAAQLYATTTTQRPNVTQGG